MSLIKCFGLSLITFIGLNVVFFFIGNSLIDDALDSFFTNLEDDLYLVLLPLFGPIFQNFGPESLTFYVSNVILGSIVVTEIGEIVLLTGLFISPLIAAIISGKLAEGKAEGFMGWFLTALISAFIVFIWGALNQVDAGATNEALISFTILTLGFGAIIGVFYGCFALLFTKMEYF